MKIICHFLQRLFHLVISRQFRTFLIILLLGVCVAQFISNKEKYTDIKETIVSLDKHMDTAETEKYIHFSIDDSIRVFQDITENQYNSIFENKELGQ